MNKRVVVTLISMIIGLWMIATYGYAETLVQKQVRLHYVVDGDTIQVWDEAVSKTVRLIGIDAAETRPSRQLNRQIRRWKQSAESLLIWGTLAKRALTHRLTAQPYLTIVFDSQIKDHYGRLLAYVFLPDSTLINEWLLKENLAHIWILPPNSKYEQRLAYAWSLANQKTGPGS